MKFIHMFKTLLALLVAILFASVLSSGIAFADNGSKSSGGGGTGTAYYPGTTVAVQVGDILITNNTSSSGMFGHAAMVDSNLNVQQMYGSPNTLSSGTESISQFFTDNSNSVQVWRFNDPSVALNAGREAITLVSQYGSDTYSLTTTLGSLSPSMYCTKFVWDAYFYGTGGTYSNPGSAVMIDNDPPNYTSILNPYNLGPNDSRLTKIFAAF